MTAQTASSIASHRACLVDDHASLIERVARRVMRRLPVTQRSVELSDLISAGVIGLFEADAKFDPSGGRSFETFAEFRVRGAMLDALRKRDFFPRRLRAKANKLARAERALRAELGRMPTEDELATHLELSTDELRALRRDTAPYSFVDNQDPELQLAASTPAPDELVGAVETHHALTEALGELPEREQLILDLYYNQNFSQRQIAGILELTEGRISQLKSAALKKLRALMATD